MRAGEVRHTVGKLSKRLQLWCGPRPDPSLGREVMNAQSPENPNRDSFGIPLWESQEKEPFWMQVQQRAVENTICGKVVAPPEFGPW
jgi:hypothetical protein